MASFWARLAALLAVAGALMPCAAAASISLRVAVLTTPGWTATDFLVQTLQGYGAPFDVLAIDGAAAPPVNMTSLLTNPDGSAKYAGLFLYPSLEAIGTLNAGQVADLRAYQVKSGARSVVFGASPFLFGVAPAADMPCSSAEVAMALNGNTPLGNSGVKVTAPLSAGGLWRCPGARPAAPATAGTCSIWASDFAATGIHMPCAATSILDFPGTNATAGLLTTYADGRESMGFLPDCGAWSPTCMVLSHLSLAWVLRGVIPGARRAMLTVHADDLFLTTEYDRVEPISGKTSYRLTPQHMIAHASWQQGTLKALMPAGSQFMIEFPWNGNGVLEEVSKAPASTNILGSILGWLGGLLSGGRTIQPLDIDDRSCLDMPEYVSLGCNCWFIGTAACPATAPLFCRQCTKDFVKPLGSGTNRVQANALATTSSWNTLTFRARDQLYSFIAGNSFNAATAFTYTHHTWSHQNLDNATAYDADMQLALNRAMAGPAYLNLANRASWSSKCMVTPQISGLLNGDALASIVKNGITCATGDNTWPFLAADPGRPHALRYTTKAANGYDGFAILPRYATEIYYNCTTPAQNEALYDKLYFNFWGANSDINTIVGREATRVVRDAILKLRADPHMMHQANLALIDGSGKSLLMRWVEAVVAEHNKYVTWPLRSVKLDDLYAMYKAREARDACNLAYTLQVDNGTVTAVTAASTSGAAGCSAPLLLPAAAAGGAPVEVEVAVPAGGVGSAPVTGVAWPAAA